MNEIRNEVVNILEKVRENKNGYRARTGRQMSLNTIILKLLKQDPFNDLRL